MAVKSRTTARQALQTANAKRRQDAKVRINEDYPNLHHQLLLTPGKDNNARLQQHERENAPGR